jgi:iron(III) transport system ATP-binding protein
MPDAPVVLSATNIRKRFGTTPVLDDVSIEVRAGEIVALLGASGSGKTTLLRIAGGLERPDAGRVVIGTATAFDGATGVDVPAEGRNLGFVFQSYALWPHMTVAANVGYGLRVRRVAEQERALRVDRTLDRLGLSGLGARYPHQLSGGQQQRVALARALVYEPPVILLDEPLSNLDANLRESARSWLRETISTLGLSAVFVTHDQVEALAIADRVVLLHGGHVEQAGTPTELYGAPRTLYAATFLGSASIIPVSVEGDRSAAQARVSAGGTAFVATRRAKAPLGKDATVVIRVECVRVLDGDTTVPSGGTVLNLVVRTSLYLGERWEHAFTLGDATLRAWGETPLVAGRTCRVWVPIDGAWAF